MNEMSDLRVQDFLVIIVFITITLTLWMLWIKKLMM